MKRQLYLVTSTGLFALSACTTLHPMAQDTPPPVPAQFAASPARITSVNSDYRFVVLDFTGRVMPAIGTRLNVYHGDAPVGVVQITEPVRARFATADIVEGEVRVGDEAQ